MQLHNLKITYKRKKVKRIGRGGKRGTYSGHGNKGQKSRAGHRIRPAERDLIQRIPKLRGFKFKSLKPKEIGINIVDLEKKIKGNIIDMKALIEAGFVKKTDKRVKILADGEAKRAFEIKGIKISEAAKKKIEAAGGTVRV
ncbi:50S ribosomal protein L15 [Candidatus Wolfebacteria bacterium]|nr:50S ribosomal protein L15 [Candidatus Wolfebacteria bacterium]